jgi:hypothetical protein
MSDFEWYEQFGKDRGKGSIGDYVAHMDGVRLELQAVAVRAFIRAQMELAVHHRTGTAHVKIEHAPMHLLDWYVLLTDVDPGGEGKPGNHQDRSVMSIEFGWHQTRRMAKHKGGARHGQRTFGHDGLHILGKAMDSL